MSATQDANESTYLLCGEDGEALERLDAALAAVRTPLRADAARNRDLLVTAAQTLFNDGQTDASLERIAEKAGVGVGTAYRRFPTREHLLLHLFAMQLDSVINHIEGCLGEPNGASETFRVGQWLIGSVPFMHSTKSLLNQLILHETAARVVRAARARLLPHLERIVERYRHELTPGITAADLLMLLLMCEKPYTISRTLGDERWQRYAGFLLVGISQNSTKE